MHSIQVSLTAPHHQLPYRELRATRTCSCALSFRMQWTGGEIIEGKVVKFWTQAAKVEPMRS